MAGETRDRGSIPVRLDFSLHSFETDIEAHLTFYPMGTGGFSTWREADHSIPSSAEVQNTWIYTSIPPHVVLIQFTGEP
jgi:hypothetical protein